MRNPMWSRFWASIKQHRGEQDGRGRTRRARNNMKLDRVISTVEVHTGGEPFRIVTSGLPKFPGKTIVERRTWLKEHHDPLRRALMFEPRGHADMYGGYLT